MDPTYEIRGHVTRRPGAPSNFYTVTYFTDVFGYKKGLKNYGSESWGTEKSTRK
jgi:hypothetical protein